MIGLVLRGLARQPLRAVLTVLALAVAVGAFTTITALTRGLMAAWQQAHAETGGDIVGFEAGLVELMSSRLPDDLGADIAARPGIAAATGVLTRAIAPRGVEGRLIVNGWPTDSPFWRTLPMVGGYRPETGQAPPGAVLGRRAMETLSLSVGDDLDLLGQRVRITGVAGFVGSVTGHSASLPLADLQRIVNRPGSVTYYVVTVGPDVEDVARLAATLDGAYPAIDFAPGETVVRRYEINRMVETVAAVVSLFALGIAGLVIVNTMAMSIDERRGEISLLRALGWRGRRIVVLIGAEALVLSVLGTAAGTTGGALFAGILAGVPDAAAFIDLQPTMAEDALRALLVTVTAAALGTLPVIAALRAPPAPLLAAG